MNTCTSCGQSFLSHTHSGNAQKYCSPSCKKREYHRLRKERGIYYPTYNGYTQARRTVDQQRRAQKHDANAQRINATLVYQRDNWICGICHTSVDSTLTYPHPQSISLDHVLPLSHGGSHTYTNTQAAHLRCNVSKGNRLDWSPQDFKGA